MDFEQIKEWIDLGQTDELESAWLRTIEGNTPPAEMAKVLESLVQADKLDTAETLGWMLLEDFIERVGPQEAIAAARIIVSAVPESDELRSQATELYKQLHGDNEHFEAIFRDAGLMGRQSPRRAFRTLNTCLAVRPGCFLVNRFDNRVVRAAGYNDALGQFELADAAGEVTHLEPKALADEFQLVDESDFRVLCQHRPDELSGLIESQPATVLLGICMSGGGQIDSTSLKEQLVPKYLAKDKWSRWWSRARTAAKRSPQLALEGRSPVVVKYYPQGRSLEEELAPAAEQAKMPLERLALLQQYVRESRQRKTPIDEGFVAPLLAGLAEQARTFMAKRPADALAAALAIDALAGLYPPAGELEYPSAADILASMDSAAAAVARLADPALWPAALDALAAIDQAETQLEALLDMTPAALIDEVAARLLAAGRGDAVNSAVAEAMASPAEHLDICLWLWKGPAKPPEKCPDKVEILTRLLNVMEQIQRDWDMETSRRKEICHRIRSAMSQRDYAAFRQAVGEMDEGVAGTIKSRIERCDGLAESVRAQMLDILRESFFSLFAVARPEPWLNEGVAWTTEAALHRRQEQLKELIDVKMLENSRAIGEAAKHGDLSENAEWKFAIEERDRLGARATRMREELAKAHVIRPENVPTETVGIGCRVLLKHAGDSSEVELTFLGPWDVDLENRVHFYRTPLALELMGKRIGQTANLKLHNAQGQYTIEKISSALE